MQGEWGSARSPPAVFGWGALVWDGKFRGQVREEMGMRARGLAERRESGGLGAMWA